MKIRHWLPVLLGAALAVGTAVGAPALKVWSNRETIKAADLNANFQTVLNAAEGVGSAGNEQCTRRLVLTDGGSETAAVNCQWSIVPVPIAVHAHGGLEIEGSFGLPPHIGSATVASAGWARAGVGSGVDAGSTGSLTMTVWSDDDLRYCTFANISCAGGGSTENYCSGLTLTETGGYVTMVADGGCTVPTGLVNIWLKY